MVHHKTDKADKILSSIARINRTHLPRDKLVVDNNEVDVVTGGILDLVRTRVQLIKTLILWLTWLANDQNQTSLPSVIE